MANARLLVVDDEELNREIIEEYLSEGNYDLDMAEDGVAAWERLDAQPEAYDAILLDRMMPRMNGLELLHKIKQDLRLQHIPVILQTAMAASENVVEGIKAGAYYYLTKPFEEQMLFSVVSTAVRDSFQLRESRRVLAETTRTLGLMIQGQFRFQTIHEARSVAALLANTCPTPGRVMLGLTELMINAVEHGNLGITYNEKSRLNECCKWEQEVNRRLQSDAYRDRFVDALLTRDAHRISITVQDQGDGFDWQRYLEMSPERAMDNHGRGIAMAGMISFDEIQYQGRGNVVTASVNLK
jgi:CheY-like chemotaxis protein